MSNVKAYLEDIVRDGLHDIAEALKGSDPSGDIQASHVIYDNTESSLTSNRVQGAIDELSTKVNSNASDISDLTTRMGTAEGDITALETWKDNLDASDIPYGNGTVEDALNKKLALLWVNSNPSTSFAAQNIDVICGKIFKSFLVEFRYYSSSINMISPTICEIGYQGMALFFGISGSGRVSSMERDVTPSELADGYRFAFTGCGVKDLTTYGSAPSTSTDNSGIIPLRIWGIG